jgi:hypothetical protein
VKETFGPVEEFDVPNYLGVFQLLLNPCFWSDVPHCFSRWNQLFVEWRYPPEKATWVLEHKDEACSPCKLGFAETATCLNQFVAVRVMVYFELFWMKFKLYELVVCCLGLLRL